MHRITIGDITLKIADQSSDLSLSFKEKIELAKLLDRLNVSVIELSPVKNLKIDSLLTKSIATAVRHSAIALPVAQDADSVEIAWNALKEAKHPRLQLKAPMSPAQMEYFWHKKAPQMLEAIRDILSRCHALCEDVEFIADDACRAEREFLCQALRTAIEAGATTVTLCDSAGLMFPDEFEQFLQDIQKEVPQLKDVRLGVMCSDALSMAGACAIAAVRAGAMEVKTVAISESGVTRLDEFAAILRARGDQLGLSCDIRHAEIKRITGQIEWMCRTTRGKGSPFDNGASGAADANGMVLSAHDDQEAVSRAVQQIGYELSDEDLAKVYEAFQRIAEKKETVGARELDSIVASAALQVPPTYQLVSFVINCGNLISASAHVKLEKNGEPLEGICLGDGPIDAAFLALEQVAGRHYELDDFQIQAVTEGHEAMGETIVRLRSNGKLYSGRGISTDIVGASIRAYVSALNKIVYEEAEA